MLKFTICFIKQGNKILLLNREKPSWMGVWNAVGGKIEKDENPRESAIREVREETRIGLDDMQFKGIVTWIDEGKFVGGMYVYFFELQLDYNYEVPVKTDEGILDWKKIEWILHPENKGIVNNIPRSIEKIISSTNCFEHRCYYEHGQLIDDEFIDINEDIEYITDKKIIEEEIFSKRLKEDHAVR